MRQPRACPLRPKAGKSRQRALLRGTELVYARAMASDRMMQAIGTLERAVSRLEQDVIRLQKAPSNPPSNDIDRTAARAALQSLDHLIDTLKARTHG